MKILNNYVKIGEMFDIVTWVTVSREGSMEENKGIDEIQKVIAWNHVMRLLLLELRNDVKEDLNLDEIGVPISENGSKIVFRLGYNLFAPQLLN